ncbi:unnamed protein product [Nezara viridula]|uniref:Uncharacterized protein n=2 Tax=Nezara viridula TaxID=85310 RepID=A0A9P0HJ16_NEZVI|nr:unnamed protein product [Nezara viridula]
MKQAGGQKEEEIPWDLVDRCLLPLVFSHAFSVILSTILGFLGLARLTLVSVFLPSIALTLALTLFYHTLKVSCAGKIVVVTGCESRIGYSIAKHLDDLGVTVLAGFSRNEESKPKLKEECSGRLQIFDLDISSQEHISEAVKLIYQNAPNGIWAVVNAASWTAFGEAEWVPMAAFKRMIDINLVGTICFTSALLPLIRKTKGRIVNLSSIHGRIPTGPRAPMSTVTAAISAFSDALRLSIAKWGVDVVLIEAGSTTTGAWYDRKDMLDEARNLWQNLSEEQKATYGENYFELKITSLREYQSQQEDLSALLRSIGDGVTRTFPLPRYTPVTRKEKIQAFVAEYLPYSVYNIIYN